MIHPVVILNLISFLSTITAMILLLKGWNRALRRDVNMLFLGLLVFTLIYCFCLILEWSDITNALDPVEDVIGALIPMWWAFIFYGILNQISDSARKQSEEALWRSEERFRETVELLPTIVCEYDKNGQFTYVNQYGLEVLGYTITNLEQGLFAAQVFPSDEILKFKDHLSLLVQGEKLKSTEYRIRCRDGSAMEVIAISAPIYKEGKVIGARSSITPITELKKIEKALRESEEKYKELANSLPQVVFETDEKGNLTFANRIAFHLFGYSQDDFDKELSSLHMLIPADRDRAMENMLRVINGEKLGGVEYTAQRKDGSTFPIVVHSNRIMHNNKPVGLRGIIIDETERKLAEEAIQALVKSTVVTIGQDFFDNVVSTLCHWLGCNIAILGEIVDDSIVKAIAMEVNGEITHDFHYLLAGTPCENVTKTGYCYYPERVSDLFPEDKDLKEMGASGYVGIPLIDKNGRVVGILNGLSRQKLVMPERAKDVMNIIAAKAVAELERKRAEAEMQWLEAQLSQSQKMEAIGTLAGGIAHDFNNILSAMMGYSELARMNLPVGHPIYDYTGEVLKAGNRAKDLVKQILTFSRKAELSRNLIDIVPIIKEGLKFLRASLPTTIEIKQHIEITAATVLANPTQIHQVLMNLCTNASHAMRDQGGVLEVTLNRIELDEDSASRYADICPGVYLELTVVDTGQGMDQSTINRAFDPFFTTKVQGEGTGMGLAVVHGIVKIHGGSITAHSELGKGSKFRVLLPLVEGTTYEKLAIEDEAAPLGTERILFVDDEKVLAGLAKELLEKLGYQVTSLTSSLEALELFKTQPTGFDLVITDQTMPDMIGMEFAKALMQIQPEIPVILCTGFSETISEEKAKAIGIAEFAMKPLSIGKLANVIRKVLDKERS